jgi:hypothetical protein
MKTFTLFVFLHFQFLTGFAQNQKLEEVCQVFHLSKGKDTTTFIVWGNKESLKIKKPLFFFRQGSRPEPLIEYHEGKYFLRFPFDTNLVTDKYHLVMVQKSGTRLVADSAYLEAFNEGMQSGDSRFLTKEYIANNNLDKVTSQCLQVINYVVNQPWVDSKKVVFCGGSEGFTIGANLVANFSNAITHAILFSGHKGRRFESEIYQIRKAENDGKMDIEIAKKEIENLYKVWEDICKYPKSLEKSYGDSYYAWHSFSVNNIDNLLKINCPLYIAYGTADGEIAIGLDSLPLDFIQNGKNNLTLRGYANNDHQFYEIIKDSAGTTIDKVYNGDKVAKDFMEWLESN